MEQLILNPNALKCDVTISLGDIVSSFYGTKRRIVRDKKSPRIGMFYHFLISTRAYQEIGMRGMAIQTLKTLQNPLHMFINILYMCTVIHCGGKNENRANH